MDSQDDLESIKAAIKADEAAIRAEEAASKKALEEERPLTPQQEIFVQEFVKTFSPKHAALNSGYAMTSATGSHAQRLLHKPNIQKAIKAAVEARKERLAIDQDDVLRHWWEIANTDMNDLVEYRRENCRHCWGVDNKYQWTMAEYLQAKAKDPSTEASGGFGFVPKNRPNPECPECGGDGVGKVFVKDTRDLSGAARRLYAGVKSNNAGLHVLIADRDKAMELVARHLGMLKDHVELTGRDGGAIEIKAIPSDPIEAAKVYKKLMD